MSEGELLSSFGAFDLNLNGTTWRNEGSYPSNRFGIGFDQAWGYQGIRTFAGYRLGRQDFPVYYQNRLTAQGGEFSVGMRMPLLQNRSTDLDRARVEKNQLGIDLAEVDIGQGQLEFQRQASYMYWQWVGAFQRYRVTQALLRIAEARDVFLRKKLKAGAAAQIDVVDNLRMITDRRTKLVASERAWEQASIALSLFIRDDDGRPVRPDHHWTAPEIPKIDWPGNDGIQRDFAVAIENRPEIHSLELQRRQMDVEYALAKNQVLPKFDLIVQGAQDVGEAKSTLDRATYEAGVLLEIPLQRRNAIGKIRVAQAKIAELNTRQKFLEERIVSEVQDVYSALERFSQMCELTSQNVDINRQMEQAEIRRFDLGKSNMLFVNLRELARAEAQLLEIDAQVQFHKAMADYRAVLGIRGS